MTILYYHSTAIEFLDSHVLSFNSTFDEKLYTFCYNQLINGCAYKPYFDTDDFCSSSAKFDLKSEYLTAGYSLPILSSKSSDKNLEICQKIIRDFFSRYPLFVGLFKNNTLLAKHSIENAKLLLKSEVTSANSVEVKGVIN